MGINMTKVFKQLDRIEIEKGNFVKLKRPYLGLHKFYDKLHKVRKVKDGCFTIHGSNNLYTINHVEATFVKTNTKHEENNNEQPINTN